MKSAIAAALVLTFVCVCSAEAARKTPIDEPSTLEGLQRVKVKGMDAVYRKPDADLSKYNKLLIRNLDVSFSRGFNEATNSTLQRLSKTDLDAIRADLAKLFAEVVVKELQTKGGYEIVMEAADDVLEIRPSIIDLFINAPSRSDPGIYKTYTTSAGRMTLIAELRDLVSTEILARVYDRDEMDHYPNWQWTTSVTNAQDAKQAISGWATTLRKSLDAARGK